jgi:hypothetical protein
VLKDKINIKEDKEEYLDKRPTNCKRIMQELCDSIKRPNLRIMDTEEGEAIQAKGICNLFNKIIAENFPNLQKEMHIRYRKPPEHQTDMTKLEPLHDILYLKQLAQKMRKEY